MWSSVSDLMKFEQKRSFLLQTTKTTSWVAWRPGGDWPSARTGPRTCTLASRASCATPTTSSVTSTTLETAVLTTAGRETTRWATTPATRRATASAWKAGRETTALNVGVGNCLCASSSQTLKSCTSSLNAVQCLNCGRKFEFNQKNTVFFGGMSCKIHWW